MTLPQRHARRLRLVAGSEEAARGAVPRFEDALRCASLPDAGSRLLLVRRMALGRVPLHASSQAIARVIEARFAEGGATWTEGAQDDRPGAERVVFASAWHARVALSSRLLRGEHVSAWYWPLAVPEFRVAVGAGDNLRAIAVTLASSAEAPVALPAWADRVVRAAGAGALVAQLPERFGESLLKTAGLPLPVGEAGRTQGIARPASRPSAASPGWGADERAMAAMPPWLQSLLRVAGWREAGPNFLPARQPRSRAAAHAAEGEAFEASTGGHAIAPAAESHATRRRRNLEAPAFAQAPPSGLDANPLAGPAPLRPGDILDTGFATFATDFAGLPLLLPVLARLGLPRWAEAGEGDPADWTRAVLGAALLRLRAPADDPAWWLATLSTPLLRLDAPAPPDWPGPPQALATAPTADAQATAWLTAVRHWLRRDARIGLASLVRRPGRIGLTPTHLDMHFALAAADLRVRRIGLDIDPGWLPWFGRVVGFHYDDEPGP